MRKGTARRINSAAWTAISEAGVNGERTEDAALRYLRTGDASNDGYTESEIDQAALRVAKVYRVAPSAIAACKWALALRQAGYRAGL